MTEIELLTLRCETVGVSVVLPAVGATLLISCSISRRTMPLTLTRGITRRIKRDLGNRRVDRDLHLGSINLTESALDNAIILCC